MKQPRSQSIVVLAAAACLIVVLTITGLVFWHTPAVQAQASTNTPRPGIQTLLTPAVQATRPTAPSPGPSLAPIPAGTSTAPGPVATSVAVSPAPTSSALAPSATTPITNTRAMTLTSSSPGAGTITVVGEGQVKIQPDIARVNIGV